MVIAEHLNVFINAVFVENILLAMFLGMCSFLSCSENVKTATGLGLAVTFVLTLTAPLNWMINNYLLSEGALAWMGSQMGEVDLSFLRFITFIAVIAAFVQVVEMAMEKFAPALYSALGIFLPLITVNCSILGVSLFMVKDEKFLNSLPLTVNYGVSSGIGWLLAILGLAAIRQKMKYSNVPEGLRGLGITFIASGLMSMAFMAFAGTNLEKLFS